MKKLFVKDLKAKDDLEDIFLVKYIAIMQGRDGRSYLNLVLTDKTGDLEARKWNAAEKIAECVKRGDYVKAVGKINQYQGRNQLVIKEVYPFDGEVNADDFIEKSQQNARHMLEELLKIIDELDDYYIQKLLKDVVVDPKVQNRLLKWQAGKTIHHAYESGLLEHILSCSQLAMKLSAHYDVNRNFVVAGAILHDLCKIYELGPGPLCDYTSHGRLVGHLVNGVDLVESYTSRIDNFPSDTKMHLKHILLSHHGHYEFGSPKLPQTSEAYLVHLIDLMDSKMNSLEQIKRHDNLEGPWSNYVKHLDRTVYKEKLPHYKEAVAGAQHGSSDSAPLDKTQKKKNNGNLTFSMADQLAGVKLESD